VKVLGFDTETELIRPGVRAPRMVCFTTSDPRTPILHFSEYGELRKIWEAAGDLRLKLVGHNIAYDAAVVCAQYPDLTPLVFRAYSAGAVEDTMLREMLLQLEATGIPRRQSLEDLSRKYLHKVLDKGDDGWRLRYGELRDLPISEWPERAVSYAVDDAKIIPAIYRAQDSASKHSDTFYDSPAQARAAFAFHLMTAWGLKTDVPRVEETIHEFERAQEELVESLQQYGVMRQNLSFDTKQLVAQIEAQSGEPLPRTAKGSASLKKDHLATLNLPMVDQYLQYKHDGKMISTYLEKYRSGLVQCSVNPILANGRASLTKPSLQNLPRSGPIREIFVPRKGKIFATIDYDGVELRTLAQTCLDLVGKSRLAEIFQEDPSADVHSMFGGRLAGVSEEEGVRRRKAGDKSFKPFRNGAKAALFGFPGGMGVGRFIDAQAAHGAHYTPQEAAKLRNAWLDWLPEMGQYFGWIRGRKWYKDELPDGTEVKRVDHQSYRSRRHRGRMSYTQLANAGFSEPMADGAKAAIYEIVRQQYAVENSLLYGSRTVCYIHDEGIFEFEEEGAHEQATLAARIMCEEMRRFTPDVPITAGPALMRRWYKDAEPEYDKNGRLVPWEPK